MVNVDILQLAYGPSDGLYSIYAAVICNGHLFDVVVARARRTRLCCDANEGKRGNHAHREFTIFSVRNCSASGTLLQINIVKLKKKFILSKIFQNQKKTNN